MEFSLWLFLPAFHSYVALEIVGIYYSHLKGLLELVSNSLCILAFVCLAMPVCSGCSKSFKFLDGERCEPCLEQSTMATSARPHNEWPSCVDCSKWFEFLRNPQCFTCKDRDLETMPPPVLHSVGITQQVTAAPLSVQDANRDVQYAMSNPINLRTHGNSTSYRNPFQSRYAEVDENDVSGVFKTNLVHSVTYITYIFHSCVIVLLRQSLRTFRVDMLTQLKGLIHTLRLPNRNSVVLTRMP